MLQAFAHRLAPEYRINPRIVVGSPRKQRQAISQLPPLCNTTVSPLAFLQTFMALPDEEQYSCKPAKRYRETARASYSEAKTVFLDVPDFDNYFDNYQFWARMDQPLIQYIHLLRQQAAALVFYPSALESSAGQAFVALLDALLESHASPRLPVQVLHGYSRWVAALASAHQSWPAHVRQQVMADDNPLTRHLQQHSLDRLPPSWQRVAQQDLRILQTLHDCRGSVVAHWVRQAIKGTIEPVVWDEDAEQAGVLGSGDDPLSQAKDWGETLPQLAALYQTSGVGIFARYRAFRWVAGKLVGVTAPDPIELEALAGYDRPRQQLLQNTEALLAGYQALNVLLYGSRGAGKSSMVKALLNRYGAQGLRLIEVNRADLRDLVDIVEGLREVPLSFIIFVDDLSFEEDDDAFKALKVVLEGTIMARPKNVVVYATSNRRHLIREFMGDRPRPQEADEVHAWDTMQEKLSFSDRFGLILTFQPADQPAYLAMVHHLAQREGLVIAPQDLEFRALQWATQHNGRSGRTARQFIDFLKADLALHPAQTQDTSTTP